MPDKVILYNTFHDHRIIIENIDNNVTKFFKKIDQGLPLSTEELETADTFLELGLLLDDDADERAHFDDWYDHKIQKQHNLLNIIVVTTMACNLRCPYCYELDQLDNKRNMSLETAGQLVDWIKKEVREKPIDRVEIVYFGGEPLMNKKALYKISGDTNKFCEAYGIDYHGMIISNGVLMTPEVSKQMRECGVRKAKITLDGDKYTHDTTRITSSGRGSFDAIWHNLEHANDDLKPDEEPIEILIGGNFLEKTYEGFFPLLDKLAASSFKEHIKGVNLKPVQDVSSNEKSDLSSNPCDTVCFNQENTDKMIRLREELTARDLPTADAINLGPCDFYRGDSFTLGLDGTIYPCIAFVDNESTAIGHITDLVPKESHATKQKEWEESKPWTEECYNCSFLPICTGGCRATAYSNGYAWDSVVCEKDYFLRMSKALSKELLGITPEPGEEMPFDTNHSSAHMTTIEETKKHVQSDGFLSKQGQEYILATLSKN